LEKGHPQVKIYLCAGSHEIAIAKDVMGKLRAMGHTITHDWVAAIEKVGCANPRNATEDQRRGWAYEDLAGIEAADVFWMMIPKTPSFGASYELAFAQAVVRRVIVSGNWLQSIFTSLVDQRFDTHEQALSWLGNRDACDSALPMGGVRAVFVDGGGRAKVRTIRECKPRIADFERGKAWAIASSAQHSETYDRVAVYVEIPWSSYSSLSPKEERDRQIQLRRQGDVGNSPIEGR
jgi:hypothetical protein